jgi:sRNA-binding regulator protein Hfq
MRKLVRPSIKGIAEKKTDRIKAERVPVTYRKPKIEEGEEDSKYPYQTFREIEYYQELVEKKTKLIVTLLDGSTVEGFLEYFDKNFIRITRENQPNAFIYKSEIKYLQESD